GLRLAQLLHLLLLGALIGFGLVAKLGPIYFWAMPLVAAALIYEHQSARSLDVAGINRAFFHSNAFVSAVFLIAVCLDRLVRLRAVCGCREMPVRLGFTSRSTARRVSRAGR